MDCHAAHALLAQQAQNKSLIGLAKELYKGME